MATLALIVLICVQLYLLTNYPVRLLQRGLSAMKTLGFVMLNYGWMGFVYYRLWIYYSSNDIEGIAQQLLIALCVLVVPVLTLIPQHIWIMAIQHHANTTAK